jgi:cell shape-determining protein MreC
MKQRWITHERALLLVMAALLVCSQLPTRLIRPLTRVPSLVLATVTQPFTDPLHQASTRVVGEGNVNQTDVNVEDLQRNYDRLLQDNEWLRQSLEESRQTVAELSQTRGIIDRNERRLVPGTVTAVQGTREAPVMTIALDANHGVERDDIVGSGFSLVGRVSDVWQRAAQVAVITRPNHSLLVTLRSETATPLDGGIPALLQSDATGLRFFTEIGVDDPVRVGDLAYLADETWPDEARGFVVGRVTSIEPKSTDPQLRRVVAVDPVRDLRYVRRVFVVVPVQPEGRP